MGKVYDQVRMFKAKYPGTITWFRLRSHAKIVEMHLNADEEPIYTFAGQLNENITADNKWKEKMNPEFFKITEIDLIICAICRNNSKW